MIETFFYLLILSLAVWRLTSLLVREDGPWNVLARFRTAIGVHYDEYSKPYGTNMLASALTCTWCASVWISAFAALFCETSQTFVGYVLTALALSALSILIDEAVS